MDITKYKEKLEEELASLTTKLEKIGQKDDNNPDDWVAKASEGTKNDSDQSDPNDNADDLEELGERNAIVSDLEIRFRNVKNALKRIEDGTYGVCEISGKPIEEDRLEANPAATTCKAHMGE